MQNKLFVFLLMLSISLAAQKKYHKSYYNNGVLKEEGWQQNSIKIDYWKFYNPNGTIKKEGRYHRGKPIKYWYFYTRNGEKKEAGHFEKGIKSNWWVFYDRGSIIDMKCQFKNNKKNGYCLIYKNKKWVKAEKYSNDKKIKEWTDLKSFRKENKMSDLR